MKLLNSDIYSMAIRNRSRRKSQNKLTHPNIYFRSTVTPEAEPEDTSRGIVERKEWIQVILALPNFFLDTFHPIHRRFTGSAPQSSLYWQAGRQARTGFNIKVQGFYALQLDVGECLSIHKTMEGGRKERRTKNVLPLLCLGDLLFNLYGRGIRSGTATKFPMFSGWLAG